MEDNPQAALSLKPIGAICSPRGGERAGQDAAFGHQALRLLVRPEGGSEDWLADGESVNEIEV